MQGSSSLLSFLILALLSVMWGSSFILIKKALLAFDPVLVGALRISISALAFTPIVLIQYRKILWRRWKLFLAVGIAGSGIPAFLYAIAQTRIDSSVTGLLNSLSPIFAMVMGVMFFRVSLSIYRFIGVMTGFAGAATLILAGGELGPGNDNLYGILIVIGTMCYGINVNLVKYYFQETPSIVISAVSFFFIGLPALGYVFMSDFSIIMLKDDQALLSFGAVFILSLIGTVLATVIFFRLVQLSNAIFASSVAFTIPVIALFWGYLDGENLSLFHFIGMALILAGVFIIRKSPESK